MSSVYMGNVNNTNLVQLRSSTGCVPLVLSMLRYEVDIRPPPRYTNLQFSLAYSAESNFSREKKVLETALSLKTTVPRRGGNHKLPAA